MTESEALREWREAYEAYFKAKSRLIEAKARLLEPPREPRSNHDAT
jgi:hypothetical protein